VPVCTASISNFGCTLRDTVADRWCTPLLYSDSLRYESAGLLILSITELRLGASLFLFDIIIVRESWLTRVGVKFSGRSSYESVVPYVVSNLRPTEADTKRKTRIAMIEVQLPANSFTTSDLIAPTGVCSAPGVVEHLHKLPTCSWVALHTRGGTFAGSPSSIVLFTNK
jgi:hypothetical protein